MMPRYDPISTPVSPHRGGGSTRVKPSPLMGEGLGGGERSTAVQLMSSDQRDLVLAPSLDHLVGRGRALLEPVAEIPV